MRASANYQEVEFNPIELKIIIESTSEFNLLKNTIQDGINDSSVQSNKDALLKIKSILDNI